MKVVVISDTHGCHQDLAPLPEGDILIHCGDFTSQGKMTEYAKFMHWLAKLDFNHKIVCPGNHDFICEREEKLCRNIAFENDILLGIDETFTIGNTNYYCCPWTSYFGGWAFNAKDCSSPQVEDKLASELTMKMLKIHSNTQVLITHGPPKANTFIDKNQNGEHCGSNSLLHALHRLSELKYCLFGHIHEGYGWQEGLHMNPFYKASKAIMVNASMAGGKDCGWHKIDPKREPFVFEI